MNERSRGLSAAAGHAERFLGGLDERPVAAAADATAIRAVLGGPMPEQGEDPEAVIDALAAGADAGIVASAGPRHFGFVIGGALPAALAADWLVSAWDQCAAFHSLSPAAAAIEEVRRSGRSTFSACRRPPASASSRAARRRTRRGWPPPVTPCSHAPDGTLSATGSPALRV